MSVSQVGGKLQIVQVHEGLELNCSGDVEAQLYFCSSKALTQGSTRCAQDCTSFLHVQDVCKIVLFPLFDLFSPISHVSNIIYFQNIMLMILRTFSILYLISLFNVKRICLIFINLVLSKLNP